MREQKGAISIEAVRTREKVGARVSESQFRKKRLAIGMQKNIFPLLKQPPGPSTSLFAIESQISTAIVRRNVRGKITRRATDKLFYYYAEFTQLRQFAQRFTKQRETVQIPPKKFKIASDKSAVFAYRRKLTCNFSHESNHRTVAHAPNYSYHSCHNCFFLHLIGFMANWP